MRITIRVAIFFIISLLIINIGCSVQPVEENSIQCKSEIKICGLNEPNPTFRTNQEIIIAWEVQLPFDYEYYNVSVFKVIRNSKESVWEHKNKFSSVSNNSGYNKFDILDPGNYQVLLTAYPNQYDSITPIFSYPARFNIGDTIIKIIKYNDDNSNGLRDPNENGLAGWDFLVGKAGETPWRYTTGEDGSIVITDPVANKGEYIIEEVDKQGWNSTNGSRKNIEVKIGTSNVVEFGTINNPNYKKNNTNWNLINELELDSWKIIFIAFLLLLILIKLSIKKIGLNNVPIYLKLILDVILYWVLIFLIKKAGWDSSENIFIIAISFFVIAPLLHRLSEMIIIILAEHVAGAAGVTVSGFFELLNLTYIMDLPEGASTPLGKVTLDLKIILFFLGLAFSTVLGIITHKVYKSNHIFGISENYWNAILIMISILFFTFIPVNEQPEQHKILELIPDTSGPLKENTDILWTTIVENKSNSLLYRFFLNGKAVTDWTPKNQWIWNATVGDNHIAVEVRDAKNSGEDYCDDIMNTTIRIWPNQ